MSALATNPSIFGRIVSGHNVEQWVLATLKTWSSTYLAEVERQNGIAAGTWERPRGWRLAPSMDRWPEDQLPCLVVQSVGTAELPLRAGDGRYRARWQINLACVVSARSEEEARALGQFYLAAHRTLLEQRPSLGGNAAGINWLDEDYTQIAFDDQRTLFAPQGSFTVEVDDVMTAQAGPTEPDVPLAPDTDPWPDWPQVETTDVHVDAVPIEGGADASRS